jgi:beta-galactosidase/beta-glucuronidase
MKNWKKLLACLLVGLMALTVFTACDASVGAPMGPKRSNAESESVKALCTKFGVTYDKELSEKAYSIANWVAGTSVSCSTNANKTELYRVGNANNEARAFLKEENYAAAFENLSMGTFGLNDFVPGFDIKTAEWSSKDDSITFVLPKDGTYPEAMTKAAKGKTKLGVAYVVEKGVSYAVVLFG